MRNATVKQEIIDEMEHLDYKHQKRVLDFVRALSVTRHKVVPGKKLLSFIGAYSDADLKEISRAVEDHCEKIDRNV